MIKAQKIFIPVVVCLMLFISAQANGQRSRQYFSYGNLQGVKRYGVSINYFDDYSKGGAIDYLKIYRNRNYWKYTLQYRERIADTEEATSFQLQLTHGNHLRQLGRRTFTRFIIGPEVGYEKKKSLLMDEQKDFIFAGVHIGFEIEYFLTRKLVFYTSAMQYGQVYLHNIRADYLFNAGLRLSIF